MVDLVRFKEIFHIWGYTKEEDKLRFDAELSNLRYKNGQMYWLEQGDAEYINGALITSMMTYEGGQSQYTTNLIDHDNGSIEFN